MRRTQSYSLDLRERIIAAREEGHSVVEIIKIFRVSRSSVERYWRMHRHKGSVAQKQRGGYRKARLQPHDERLRDWIEKENTITLLQIQIRLKKSVGVRVSLATLARRVAHIGLSYKKNASRRRARAARFAGGEEQVALGTKKLGH